MKTEERVCLWTCESVCVAGECTPTILNLSAMNNTETGLRLICDYYHEHAHAIRLSTNQRRKRRYKFKNARNVEVTLDHAIQVEKPSNYNVTSITCCVQTILIMCSNCIRQIPPEETPLGTQTSVCPLSARIAAFQPQQASRCKLIQIKIIKHSNMHKDFPCNTNHPSKVHIPSTGHIKFALTFRM